MQKDVTRDENQIKVGNLYEDFIQIFLHKNGSSIQIKPSR
jgi:hypothetical protein